MTKLFCSFLILIFLMLQYGISPERFQNNEKLCNFFEILTTSPDKDNKVLMDFPLLLL